MQGTAVRAVVAALLGALVVFVGAGLLSLTAGLLVVAAAVGWGAGVAVRAAAPPARRRTLAVGIAMAALVGGFGATWALSRTSGGTLDPVGLAAETLGLVAPLALVIGAIAARIGSR